MNFIHAQLLIFYDHEIKNPAIPFLTYTNIFNKELQENSSHILDLLAKLGNDFEVQNYTDFLLIKINFLEDKIQYFTQFLKSLFRHKSFSVPINNKSTYYYSDEETAIKKQLRKSITDYWSLFTETKNWGEKIAMQIAYDKLLTKPSFRNTFTTPDSLSRINISQIRSFYQRIYTPENSMIVLKGNLNPRINGLLEIALKSFKKQPPRTKKYIPLEIKKKREIVIFDIDKNDTPQIFWIETIPPPNHEDHIPLQIINNIIFAYPVGRLIRGAASNWKISELKTDIVNHKQISLICNSFYLPLENIENVIQSIYNEKSNLKLGGIYREEYLNAAKFFYGQLKVRTSLYDYNVKLEINRTLYNPQAKNLIPPSELFQKITLSKLNQTIEDTRQNIIVIIGNYNLIMDHLKVLKPTRIKFMK